MRERLTGLVFMASGGLMTALVLAMVFEAAGRQLDAEQERAAVEQVLKDQSEAWNRGDLDAFMDGYDRSGQLTFYSGGAVHQGWDAALQRYRERYQAKERGMGTLSFRDLRVELAGQDLAWVRGAYLLTDGPKSDAGLFTLVLRKTPAGWRIVHDHTSQ